MTQSAALSPSRFALFTRPGMVAGLALTALLATAAILSAQLPAVHQAGLSALTLAIVLGMLAGNTFFPALAVRCGAGVDFSKNMLLRAGIILFGFRITFQDIAHIGWAGVLVAALMV